MTQHAPETVTFEELEARFEMASFGTMYDGADVGCCSGSCCLVGGNCAPAPVPTPVIPEVVIPG